MFDFSKINTTSSNNPNSLSIRVSQKNIDQVKKTSDVRQACIILGGKTDVVGAFTFQLEGESYTMVKGKDNCFWPGHQAEHLTQFSNLYTKLAATPGQEYPITTK